jgi:formyl-CoA transferase
LKSSEFFEAGHEEAKGPLSGLRVVEATTTWAGPMCGCLFADLGAEVIKVETPAGEVARSVPPHLPGTDPALSFMNQTVNRGKRSLTLDLRAPRGQDIFLKLAASADVVVENFRPGTLANWGIGYLKVRQRKPEIVYVSISGFGQYGSQSDQAGYDPIAQASSGWLSLNGEPEGNPVKAPTFIADDLAGLHAAFSALAALRHRDQTGEGQYIDVALQDVLLFQSNGYPTLAAMGYELPRLGSQFMVAAPAGVFRCQDGFIMTGVLTDRHWRVLAELIGRPELVEDPNWSTAARRVANRDESNALLQDYLSKRTVASVVEEFLTAKLPVSAVRSYAEAAADSHVRERGMLEEIELEDGSIAPIVGPAAKFSRTPGRIQGAAPALGRDSQAILADLGLDEEAIAALRKDGVI